MNSELVWILAIAVVFLFVQVSRQKKILTEMRDRLTALENSQTSDTPWPSVASETSVDTRNATKPASPEPPKAWPTSTKANSEQKPFVFNSDNISAVSNWLKEKWFYAIAALSLVLAGVFLVQYGVENGFLSPFWRIIGALSLGVALVGGGEWIRRRASDEVGHAAALPSTFSGAGVVVLFTGILAARQMFGLIGAEVAFAVLLSVSIVALVLGWYYGPFLSVVGLLGASVAPFLVGGPSNATNFLYGYFALISFVGLAIDTVRRRAWVSVLALIFPSIAAWMVLLSSDSNSAYFLGFVISASIFAMTIPVRSLWPTQSGTALSVYSWARFRRQNDTSEGKKPTLEFPTALAFASLLAAHFAVFFVGMEAHTQTEAWATFAATVLLFGYLNFGLRKAPALWEMVAGPAFLFLLLTGMEGLTQGPLSSSFLAAVHRPPETSIPPTVYILIMLGVLMSTALYLRSHSAANARNFWALGAALTAPLTIILIDALWYPLTVISASVWATIAMGIAALMVLFAERSARRNAGNRQRAALFATAAMGMISLALVTMLSAAALTVSLAVMVFLAALLDRKYDMWLLSLFAQLGAIAVGFRYAVYPGFEWLAYAGLSEILLFSPILLVLLIATWIALEFRKRIGAIVVVESSFWSMLAVFLSALFIRLIDLTSANEELSISVVAIVMLLSMANQLYRAQEGGKITRVFRYALAWIFGLIGFALLAVEIGVLNPVWGAFPQSVAGPILLNTLLVSYAFPALIFAVIAWKMTHLKLRTQIFFGAIASLMTVVFAGLEIRHLWRGSDMERHYGVFDGELYSYTIAMLITAAALLFVAFSKRDKMLRRFAMIGIGLTIAKVFLLDMSGLAGLIRVASFLGLGLSLAGLAWINGNMSRQWDNDLPEPDPPEASES